MNNLTLCPACLTVLPEDYPYDHVAIDRTLTTQPERFTTMTRPERREVIITGLNRGMSIKALAALLHHGTATLQALLPADHPDSATSRRTRRAAERIALDTAVQALWSDGLPDTDISLRTGRSVYAVADARRRLGLATHPTPRHLFAGGTR
ncbi:hypothetical protein [Actinoplanes philippinensis]|uniref:hypothetical protein n=1 Tax=Actinoplanes philippinensis TaxID=35752 RepID=UPI0034099996